MGVTDSTSTTTGALVVAGGLGVPNTIDAQPIQEPTDIL